MTVELTGDSDPNLHDGYAETIDGHIERLRAAGLPPEVASRLLEFLDEVPDEHKELALDGLRKIVAAHNSTVDIESGTVNREHPKPVSDLADRRASRQVAEDAEESAKDRIELAVDSVETSEPPAEMLGSEQTTPNSLDKVERVYRPEEWDDEILDLLGDITDDDGILTEILAMLENESLDQTVQGREYISGLMEKFARFIPVAKHIQENNKAHLSVVQWKMVSRLTSYGLKPHERPMTLQEVRSMFGRNFKRPSTFEGELVDAIRELVRCELSSRTPDVTKESLAAVEPPLPARAKKPLKELRAESKSDPVEMTMALSKVLKGRPLRQGDILLLARHFSGEKIDFTSPSFIRASMTLKTVVNNAEMRARRQTALSRETPKHIVKPDQIQLLRQLVGSETGIVPPISVQEIVEKRKQANPRDTVTVKGLVEEIETALRDVGRTR